MKCTHVALQVKETQRSIAFYERYCQMKCVHQRSSADGDGQVTWLGWGEDPPQFVIVLIEQDYELNRQPEWQHIGMAVESRDDVDDVYERARADGLTNLWPPRDAGPIVGYYCGLIDPDGNRVEFSCGQRLG